MPSYRGKFQYQGQNGSLIQQGSCQIQFDEEKFTLTPGTGAPMVFDLGDVDSLNAADYEIRLLLYTGNALRLQQFGKSYENLTRELLESYRKRMLQCLLLEDMEELDRFAGAFALEAPGGSAASGPAEVRLFKSNVVVLPMSSQAFQWRLADVEMVRFDSQNYEIVIESQSGRLRINRLAKRTELFHTRLRDAVDTLKAESGQALAAILPFLHPEQAQNAAGILREGHSAATAKLEAVHPRIPEALAANAVDKALKPYYDDLLSRTAKGSLFAGFKLIRREDHDLVGAGMEEGSSEDDGAPSRAMPDADEAAPQALYWFFFPIAATAGGTEAGNVVAWEASSTSGRATYFFRMVDPAEVATLRDQAKLAEAVARINRVLGILNFRRRPIYLSDDELSGNAMFHRYAIAARRIPDLRQVRSAFLGRALHSSFEAWQGQVKSILNRVGQ